MSLLFDAPLIDGLRYAEEALSQVEERELLERLGAIELAPFRFHGWLGNRKTASFGWRYDFDDASFSPTQPIPDWLEPLRKTAASVAGIRSDDFVHVLLARYDPGAGIGWHRDRPHFDHVVGISLGAAAAMRFRRRTGERFARVAAPLPPRGIYHLHGEARHDWEHSIAAMTETRWSITLRSLSERGRRMLTAGDGA